MVKKMTITSAAARRIVELGASSREVSTSEPGYVPEPYRPVEEVEIRLARLQSAWERNAAGLWHAQACFIVGDGGRADTSFLFDACCPTAVVKPEGEPYSWRFYVVWRGRWESLQHYVKPGAKYAGGAAIEVSRYDSSSGAILIDNAGLRGAKVATDDSYTDQNGILYFNPRHFSWKSSSIGIVGKREICLRTRLVKVVTDVVDGVPQYAQVETLGGE